MRPSGGGRLRLVFCSNSRLDRVPGGFDDRRAAIMNACFIISRYKNAFEVTAC
jgi:hypothetical protein